MFDAVVDASAILAVVFDEPGAKRVAGYLPGAIAATVDGAEVLNQRFKLGMPEETAGAMSSGWPLTVQPFAISPAFAVARLGSTARGAGLALGDRAGLALAKLRRFANRRGDIRGRRCQPKGGRSPCA